MEYLLNDNIVQEVLSVLENQECFDCGSPDSSWSSVNNGVLICLKCSAIHKGLSQRISIVKSIDADQWTEEQLQFIRIGGNKGLKEFLLNYQFSPEIAADAKYRSVAVVYYREKLKAQVLGTSFERIPPSAEAGVKILEHLSFAESETIQDPRELLLKKEENDLEKIKQFFVQSFEKTKQTAEKEATRVQQKIAETDFQSEFKILGQKLEEKTKTISESSKVAIEKTKDLAEKTKTLAQEKLEQTKLLADNVAGKTKEAASVGFFKLKQNIGSTWNVFKSKFQKDLCDCQSTAVDDDILQNEDTYKKQ